MTGVSVKEVGCSCGWRWTPDTETEATFNGAQAAFADHKHSPSAPMAFIVWEEDG